MTLILTAHPAVEPVTIAEARAHLRLSSSMDDVLLAQLIAGARQEVERQTGEALIEQCWRLCLDDWPPDGIVLLRRTPVREILAVTIYGADGGAELQQGWQADLISAPARLLLPHLPRPGLRLNGIEIDFRCGYGAAGPDVPDLMKRAMLMLVAHWYEFRGVVAAADHPACLPAAFERLIASFRPMRLT